MDLTPVVGHLSFRQIVFDQPPALVAGQYKLALWEKFRFLLLQKKLLIGSKEMDRCLADACGQV